jgi:tRNA G18 (ribose-2'-O)-methylase SpoU
VKALLGPRGKKLRTLEKTFVADGLQSLRSALMPQVATAPLIDLLYLTDAGLEKLRSEFAQEILDRHEIIMVSEQVMGAMADTQSPQGILISRAFPRVPCGKSLISGRSKIPVMPALRSGPPTRVVLIW